MTRYEVERGHSSGAERSRREPGQVVAVVVAALFALAAVLDVGPGLMDNLVHLSFGILGVWMSRDPRGARVFLIGGGVAYFLLWQFGSVIDPTLVPFHTTSVAVHMSLVASMIGLAVLSGGRVTAEARTSVAVVFRDVPAEFTRSRPTRNRPPGRDDRHTAPPLPSQSRDWSVLACRV